MAENGALYSSLILFVSSHGNVHDDGYEIIQTYDKGYRKSELWECFVGKSGWNGKPLLFFFQACRGDDATPGVSLNHDAAPVLTPIMRRRMNGYPDLNFSNLFIMNATQPNARAFRTKGGEQSKFVDAICEYFKKYSKTLDLYSIAVKICNKVAIDVEICGDLKYTCSQQMPCFESTLTSKLVLTDNFKQTTKTYYESRGKPVVLFLNYALDITEKERTDTETKLLKTWFSQNGYDCKVETNLKYSQYRKLSKYFVAPSIKRQKNKVF